MFVPSLPGPRAVVWAVGDGADAGPTAQALARRIEQSGVHRLLYLGDTYHWSTAAEFAYRYGSVYGALAKVTAPTPGNHDVPTAAGYDPYWLEVKGRRPPPYYSFTAAGWQILSLNSEIRLGVGSPQDRWLRASLRAPGTCRIAYWHRPRFSAGVKGDDRSLAPFWRRLRGRTSIVVNGHDHNMQRFQPRDGITQFVVGSGGHSHYPVNHADPRLRFSNDAAWGALRLELRRGRAAFAFVSVEGRTLDSGSIRCRPLGATRP